MDEEWEVIAGPGVSVQTPALLGGAAGGGDEWEVVATPQPEPTLRDKLYGISGLAAQGLTMGFGDEFEAGARALANQLGIGSETYTQALGRIRAENKAFAEANPKTAIASEIGGGILSLPLGGAALRGAQTLVKGKAALEAAQAARALQLEEAARNATALSKVGTAAYQGAKTGALTGGVYGFGSGEGGAENRLENAALGLGVGGVAGGVLGAGAGGVEALIGTETAQRFIEPIRNKAKEIAELFQQPLPRYNPERGAIRNPLGGDIPAPVEPGMAGAGEIPKLTPGETAILDWTKPIPRADLDAGVVRLSSAVADGAPVLPAEAINKPSLYHLARDVRNETRSIDIAEKFLEPRNTGTAQRYYTALDDIAPGDKSTLDGLLALKGAMQKRVEGMEEARDALVKPLYEKARASGQVIKNETVDTLLKEEPELQKAITKVRQFGETLDGRKMADLPDDSLEVLQNAENVIDAKLAKAIENGDKYEVAQYSRIKKKLKGALNEANEDFKQAEAKFGEASQGILKLTGGDEQRGVFQSILQVRDENASSIGNRLFSLKPQQISEIRTALGDEYQEQFMAGVRGHLQDLVEKGQFKKIGELLERDQQGQSRLATAIGDEKFQKLKSFFDNEGLIKKGNDWYFEGPRTAGNLAIAEKRKALTSKITGLFKSFLGGGVKDGLETAADAVLAAQPKADDLLMRDMAKILFDPSQGYKSLERISRYRNMREPYLEALARMREKARGGMGGTAPFTGGADE